MHAMQLAEHGGAGGMRDVGLLDSALARPQNLYACGSPDAAALAANYAYGIARNHPFADGDKRTAFVAGATFLMLNGFEVTADESAVVLVIVALAAGDLEEESLASWFRDNSAPR